VTFVNLDQVVAHDPLIDGQEARYWRYAMMSSRHRWGGNRKQRHAAAQRRLQFIRRYRSACRRAGRLTPIQQVFMGGRGGGVFGSTADTAASYAVSATISMDGQTWHLTTFTIFPDAPESDE